MKRVLFSTLALSFGLSIQAQFTTQVSPSREGGQWFFGVGVGFHSNTMRYSDLDEELFSDPKNLNSGFYSFCTVRFWQGTAFLRASGIIPSPPWRQDRRYR